MTDLHMHSRYSEDGEFTTAELVERCAQAGVTVMSITDHNCARANNEARPLAEARGIRYIPGIEIDCVWNGLDFHLLGYGMDPESPDLRQVEENVRRQGRLASRKRLERTRALGFDLREEELETLCAGAYWSESWSGELFAEVLLARPDYRDHPLLLPYRPGGSRSDNPLVNFYWDYYAQGKPCHAPMEYPPLAETAAMLHRIGGRAVLAHPGANLRGREELLEEMLDLGLDGVEAFSSYHTPEQSARFYRLARERGLLTTCGSDYHGKTKPAIRLGGYGPLPEGFTAL